MVVEQLARTGSMKINPYQAFAPVPARVICMVWSADRRPPASLAPFLDCVRATCGGIAAGWSGRKQVPA